MKANKLMKALAASAMSLALVAGMTAMPAMAETNPLTVSGNTVSVKVSVDMNGAVGAGLPKATYNFTVASIDVDSITSTKENNAKDGVMAAVNASQSVVFDGSETVDGTSKKATDTLSIAFTPTAFNDTGAGIYYYKLTQTNANYAGLTQDCSDYVLKVYVTNGGTGLELNSAELRLLTGTTVGATKTDEIVNSYATTTLTLSKNVDGDFGDRTRPFSFSITLTDPNTTVMNSVTVGSESKTFTGGTLTFTYNLKHGENVVIQGLPAGVGYSIQETGLDGTGYTVTYTDTANTLATETGVNPATGTTVATAETITATNTIQDTPATGIILNVAPYALMVVIALAGVVVFLRKRVED